MNYVCLLNNRSFLERREQVRVQPIVEQNEAIIVAEGDKATKVARNIKVTGTTATVVISTNDLEELCIKVGDLKIQIARS